MIRFKSFTHAPQAILFLSLLVITTFGLACKGARSLMRSDKAFEGEIMSKMYLGDSSSEIRSAIKGNRIRTETEISLPQFSMGASLKSVTRKSVMIMDLSSKTMTSLDPQEKTYTTINFGEKDAELPKTTAQITLPKVTSTGKTETIAGYTCKHWLIDDKTDVCMAQGLGNFGGGGSENLFNLYSAEIKSGKEIQ